MESLAARHEEGELRAGGDKRGELARRRKQVLDVVDQKQQPLWGKVLGELLPRPHNLRDRRA